MLAFPDQPLSDAQLERFSLCFGPFGDDPFIAPIPGSEHVIAIRRAADGTAPLFAENWHTDWRFQARPPSGTCLYGITIPPHGGDTLYANQHAALDAMPAVLRTQLEGRQAIHSARGGYAPQGMYGEADKRGDRSMDIPPSEAAMATQLHPIIRPHPQHGTRCASGSGGHLLALDGMTHHAAPGPLPHRPARPAPAAVGGPPGGTGTRPRPAPAALGIARQPPQR